jgi:hypothetical protein
MESYTVVGGGIAGLTAANALAGNGNRVTLLEQSERLGGRAITQQDRGYLLNLGPHALYRDGQAMRTLREWRIPVQGHRPAVDSNSWLVCGNRNYSFITGPAGLLQTRLFDWRQKIEAVRLLRAVAAGKAAAGETMEQWLLRHTRSGRVRHFASALVRLSSYARDLRHLSAPAALAQLGSALKHGVLYLDGGWQTFVDGLAGRARSFGVEIRCGVPMETIDAVNASGVVLAMPPSAVEWITGVAIPKLAAVRMACLDIGLWQLPDSAVRFALGVDRPLYFSVHSATAKLAPEGAALAHVGKYLGAGEPAPGDRQELEEFADRAMPGWRGMAEVVRFLPNMTVSYGLVTPEGRPDVDALGWDGVAIAGDWVGPDGMLADAAVASGLRAARMLERRQARAA